MYAAIVLPAFNEEDSIGPLLREIRDKIDGLPVREVVLVDDGSTDATAANAIAAWGSDPSLRIIRHGRRQGQSRALLTGIRAASTTKPTAVAVATNVSLSPPNASSAADRIPP